MTFPSALRARFPLPALLRRALGERLSVHRPTEHPQANVVAGTTRDRSDVAIEILASCVDAMTVLQARTVELSAEVEEHMKVNAMQCLELRSEIEALKEKHHDPQPQIPAVEEALGPVAEPSAPTCVAVEPGEQEMAALDVEVHEPGVDPELRLSHATTAVQQHRSRVAALRAALAAAAEAGSRHDLSRSLAARTEVVDLNDRPDMDLTAAA